MRGFEMALGAAALPIVLPVCMVYVCLPCVCRPWRKPLPEGGPEDATGKAECLT